MIDEDMYQAMVDESKKIGTFGHGYTYGGHPVPAAVALRTLQLMEERDLLGHTRKVMVRFQERLHGFADHPLVGQTRGVGMIGAIELVANKATKTAFAPSAGVGAYCANRSQEYGLIHRPLGDSVAFCPPLIITEAEIDEMFDRFAKALEDTEAWVAKEGHRAAA